MPMGVAMSHSAPRVLHHGLVAMAMYTLVGCPGGGGGNGCGPIDVTNDVDPAGGTPAELVEEAGVQIWQVKWDNPVVGDTSFELPADGFAQRSGNVWNYNRFDLTANEISFVSQNRSNVATWPQAEGIYDGTFLAWEMHGVELAPRTTVARLNAWTAVRAIRDDCTSGEVAYKGLGFFQLDPNVAVVPIRVVVFHPTPFDDSFPAGWFGERSAKLLFDDRWRAVKDASSNPDCNPNQVVGFWTHRPGCRDQTGCATVVHGEGDEGDPILQPDRIWDQCDVQFRMISYHQCAIAADEFTHQGVCNLTGHGNTLSIRANECGVPHLDGATRVLFVRSLVDPKLNCFGGDTFGGFLPSTQDVYITAYAVHGLGRVLAHELGHSLGEPHVADSCAETDNLMCEAAPSLGGLLTASQCEDAHANAMGKHQAFW